MELPPLPAGRQEEEADCFCPKCLKARLAAD
jgi:hypothetical protein